MTDVLIVVDSSAKAEFMQSRFGKGASCVVCGWPLFTVTFLPSTESGAAPAFRFDGLPAAASCVAHLDAHIGRQVILALDSHSRAELLCWQIRGYLLQQGASPQQVKRLALPAFTPEALDSALAKLAPMDEHLGFAAACRQVFDERLAKHLLRLIGTASAPGGLAFDHHSMIALFLLAEREQTRLMQSQAPPRWQVLAQVSTEEASFEAKLSLGPELTAKGILRDGGVARHVCGRLAAQPLVVHQVSHSPITSSPPRPYQLADLIPEAHDRLALGPGATLDLVDRLRHGVDRGDGQAAGIILLHDPAAEPLSQAALRTLRQEIADRYGQAALADQPEALAPGAILPLGPQLDQGSATQALTAEAIALYNLIHLRALVSQMRVASGERLTVGLMAGREHAFEAQFQKLTEPGFTAILPALADHSLPAPISGLEKERRFAPDQVRLRPEPLASLQPYTVEALFAELAEFAIAPDHTALRLVDDLIRTGYLGLGQHGLLSPTNFVAKVVPILNRAFPRMQGLNLSAYIEQTISEVTSGRKGLGFALTQFDQTMMLHGKGLLKPKIPVKLQPRRTATTIIKQAEAVPGEGRPGPAAPPVAEEEIEAGAKLAAEPVAEAESAGPPPEPQALVAGTADEQPPPFPTEVEIETAVEAAPLPPAPEPEAPTPDAWSDDLKRLFAESLSRPPEEAPNPGPALNDAPSPPTDAEPPGRAGRDCPACGKPMLRREDAFGPYWGCSGFPACRYSEALNPADLKLPCPLCGQALSRKQTPTGKTFYVCVEAACQFMSWSLPHYLPCGLCDSPYLVEKVSHGQARLHCPRAGCPYEQALPGSSPPPSPPQPKAEAGRPAATTRKVRIVRRQK